MDITQIMITACLIAHPLQPGPASLDDCRSTLTVFPGPMEACETYAPELIGDIQAWGPNPKSMRFSRIMSTACAPFGGSTENAPSPENQKEEEKI